MKHVKHKCINCAHCNDALLICTPEAENLDQEYRLELSDLYTEDFCDYFIKKEEEYA